MTWVSLKYKCRELSLYQLAESLLYLYNAVITHEGMYMKQDIVGWSLNTEWWFTLWSEKRFLIYRAQQMDLSAQPHQVKNEELIC